MNALPKQMNIRLRAIAAKWGASTTFNWLSFPETIVPKSEALPKGKLAARKAKKLQDLHEFLLNASRYDLPEWLVDDHEYEQVEEAGRIVEDCEAAVISALARLAEAEKEFNRRRVNRLSQ